MVNEVAQETAKKAVEIVKEAVEREVQELPEEIGELSEVELLPEEIGEEPQSANSQVSNESNQENTQEKQMENNNNDLQNETNESKIEDKGGVEKPKKSGGSYGEVFIEGEGEKYEVHHMPADSVSDFERNDGPAIKMEKADHRQTASCGSSNEAKEYRAVQKELIGQGKFREALQMDIDDIYEKFGDKYDNAIAEMFDYIDKLEMEGKLDV